MAYVPIILRTVENKVDYREVVGGFSRNGDGPDIPADFLTDGASVPWFLRWLFPKWKHPKAVTGHDYDCLLAKSQRERKIADERFRRWVRKSNERDSKVGYAGVRVGARFGIGNRF
jgi:hypothetical protein